MHFPPFQFFYHRLLVFLPFVLESQYDDPHKGSTELSKCKGHHQQSPISISTFKTIPINLPKLLLQFYDEPFNEVITLRNTGHTIKFKVPETIYGTKPFITGGLLQHIYVAEAVHFHWGSPHEKGSEHSIDGKRFDLEMHILHKNAKYSNIKQARQFEDGLSVVAVLFKAVRFENVYYPGLNIIFETLDELTKFNTTAQTVDVISLGSLLGDINRQDFITYQGSLTTPPCSESVTWQVFPQVLPISYNELSKFWNIKNEQNRPLRNNFRKLQKLEHRKVFRQTYFDWNERFINLPTPNPIRFNNHWQ